jgi:hypothetical protein
MLWRFFMKFMRRTTSVLVLIGLLASTLLFNGCGRKEAESEGCPSGSYVANDTDTLTGPADGAFTGGSSFGNPFSGGTVLFSPLTYTVKDNAGVPRNKVCITLYTGGSTGNGFWYSDSTYSTVVTGSGELNRVVAVTDNSGRATLYWSTENLPPANSAIPSTTTPITYTAGKDQAGISWVKAYSGTLETIFNLSWTVQGEPAP